MATRTSSPASKRERQEAAKAARERATRRAAAARRAKRAGLWVAGIGGVTLIGFLLALNARGDVAYAGDLRRGGQLDELTLPVLEGEGTIDYAATYADRPVVLNFFASWCPNCIAEMPDFEAVHQDLGGEVAFLGVSQSDGRQASVDLARETGISYPAGFDARGDFFNALGAQGMPTTVFIEPGGRIADVWVGQLNDETLRQLVIEHFGV